VCSSIRDVISDGMTTYPGLPGPVICDFLSREESRAHYAEGTEPICERLTGLDALPPSGARFFAVPPRLRGAGTFPVRACVELRS
jgi:kynurenine formamidase